MNMRKIIAVLAAVLMLCTIIPMGAISVSAAPGDVIINKNFDDGSVFTNARAENGYMVFDATTADWANVYMYANAIKSGTKYEISFDAKANKAASMNVKINNNWGGDTFKWTTNITTEWATYTCVINPDELKQLTATALLMFTSNATAANGAIYHIDNVVVKEYLDPATIGAVKNGDFEAGSLTGWSAHQSTVISTAAAHSGSYGANLKGNGGWGGMLNQDVPVVAGKSYEVSLWVKAVANGVNVQVKDGGASGNNMASKWFNGTSWTQLTWTVIPTTDVICFNFCGGGNGIAEDVYVDDIVISELKDPSFDGYIYNGDFETGKVAPWDVYSGTAASADAAYTGDYGLYCVNPNGGWGGTANQSFTTEVGKTYVIWMYAKAIAKGQNIQIKDNGVDKASKWFTATEWTKLTFEYTAESTKGMINICGGGTGVNEAVYFDDIVVFEKQATSNDGYIVNGTFDDGALTPWNNLWGSCPKAEVVFGGKDSTFALEIVSGEWKHVRQTNIAVEANTEYKISFYSKNVKNMNLLVKDNADTANITNKGIANSDDWALTEITFNTGDNTAILVSFMGAAAEAYGTFDTVVMEKLHTCNVVEQDRVDATCTTDGYIKYACDCGLGEYTEPITAKGHTYDSDCDPDCNVCYENRAELTHNVIHVAAKAATCTAMGNIEYWYCDACGMAWLDEACTLNTNLRAVNLPMAEHTYFNDCSAICEACGYEREVSHNVIHVAAKAPTCTAMGNLEYWYCDVCGAAWLDAECTLNTNLRAVNLPMAEHTYDNDFDADCNGCGAKRDVVAPATILNCGGKSASEDVHGLAVKFNVTVDGMEVNGTTAIYDNATLNGYKLISMGAIADNGVSQKDIPAVYLCDLEDGSASFAVRIINIPEGKENVEITFTPYVVVVIDGVPTTIYGEAQTGTYAEYIG